MDAHQHVCAVHSHPTVGGRSLIAPPTWLWPVILFLLQRVPQQCEISTEMLSQRMSFFLSLCFLYACMWVRRWVWCGWWCMDAHAHHPCCSFRQHLHGWWGLNTSPRACVTRTLAMALSPELLCAFTDSVGSFSPVFHAPIFHPPLFCFQ